MAEMETKSEPGSDPGGLPKYYVVVDGVTHDWSKGSISFEEIVQLGGWSAAEGVIEVDEHNVEHTIQPGVTVQLKPGHGFSKKVRWKRG
jgi:hypothetical protein